MSAINHYINHNIGINKYKLIKRKVFTIYSALHLFIDLHNIFMRFIKNLLKIAIFLIGKAFIFTIIVLLKTFMASRDHKIQYINRDYKYRNSETNFTYQKRSANTTHLIPPPRISDIYLYGRRANIFSFVREGAGK